MIRRSLVIVLALALAACGPGIKVTRDIDTQVDKTLATYGFLKDSDDLSSEQRRVNRIVKDMLRDKLNAKGYQQVSADPDFVVGQFAAAVYSLEEVEVVDDVDKRLEQRELMSGDQRIDERLNFEEARLRGMGTLLVFMTDPDSGEVFWRSRAETDLAFEGQGLEKIDEAVSLIMEDFPALEDR